MNLIEEALVHIINSKDLQVLKSSNNDHPIIVSRLKLSLILSLDVKIGHVRSNRMDVFMESSQVSMLRNHLNVMLKVKFSEKLKPRVVLIVVLKDFEVSDLFKDS